MPVGGAHARVARVKTYQQDFYDAKHATKSGSVISDFLPHSTSAAGARPGHTASARRLQYELSSREHSEQRQYAPKIDHELSEPMPVVYFVRSVAL